MQLKFYICQHCGNIIAYVENNQVEVFCCGEAMSELVPNTTEAAVEKHIPVVEVEGNRVKVSIGSAEHPMVPEHYIKWVALQTSKGNQRKFLESSDKPEVIFYIDDGDTVEAVYAFCNIHGLWKK